MPKSADPVDELFEAPLGEFTRLRDELATRLRDEGRTSEANEVKKLRRPTVVAWTVNQLARRENNALSKLIQVQRDIGRATSRERINELSSQRRDVVAGLLDRATAILQEGGHSATAQTKQKITQTLLATNSDEERRIVAEGRLQQEITSSSFGDAVVAMASSPRESKASERARETVETLTKELKEARAEVQRLTRETRRLNAQAQEAAKQAQAQERAVARLERRLDDARKKLKKVGQS